MAKKTTHHWNWHISTYSKHALDPRHLFLVDKKMHGIIHNLTTRGSKKWVPESFFAPIDPIHIIHLDGFSHPLK